MYEYYCRRIGASEIKQYKQILDVTIDPQLDFSNHVKAMCKKLTIRSKALYRLSAISPESSKLEFVRSTILPAIHYALSAFSCCWTQGNLMILTWLLK